MNLILLFPKDYTGNGERVRLCGRRFRHIVDVHQVSVGQNLRVGLVNGQMGTGSITNLKKDMLEMEVELSIEPPSALPVTLILALPRPKVLKRVLLCATSMGVKKIILLNTWRVEKSFWKSPALQEEKIREALVLGLEQACDTIFPEVMLRPLFKPFVEDELPELIQGTLPLMAHPGGSTPFPGKVEQAVTLAMGSEGGFISYEVEKLQECGFQMVSLGERILRVESAVPALLSRLL